MMRWMTMAAGAALLLTACEQGPMQGAIPGTGPQGTAGTYVFNDGTNRFSVQVLDPPWTPGSSIESGEYRPPIPRAFRVADDRMTRMQARYKASAPRREVAVMTVSFDESSGQGQTAQQRAATKRAAEAQRCAGAAIPPVVSTRTADGKPAYIVQTCRTGDLTAGAVAYVDDRARPAMAVSHGPQGDYWREPLLVPDAAAAFTAVVQSYKSVP